MKKVIKIVLNISFVFYLFALVVLLFLGTRGFLWSGITMIEYIKNSSNFIPFKTINTYIRALFDGSMNIDIPIKNLFGNLFMFLPAGIYLPYCIRKAKEISVFIISLSILLVVIEVVQVVTRRGSFDIDDFILNMLGALIGFGIWKTKFVQKLLR
ncbi:MULTISPECIES: VanZ family protein [unclassified Psychrobacillus]|uniref:VanZ family protein n=1 Tax=unclassified Psychrobacillus TaxID=2636677 RepID=UPI00146F3E71|nr:MULTISPECIES: VanZ family protein [unclassified Psychrobacillus]MCM3358750.1 VanZ family protein [Psychrobacillus sp. MER TA 171]NME06504.1 VanZ family protein [Psychrobacillus sp. BL-248-WT-3]